MFLLRVYNAIKPATSFCQVFKVEICEANTTVTWQVDIIFHKAGSFTFSLFLCPNTAFYCGIRAKCLRSLQNSGLSDMKIFVFNRFCNTFFKNVFSGRWNSLPWLATKPKNRIIFKASALLGAEAFYIFDKNSVLTYRQGGEKYIKWEKFS